MAIEVAKKAKRGTKAAKKSVKARAPKAAQKAVKASAPKAAKKSVKASAPKAAKKSVKASAPKGAGLAATLTKLAALAKKAPRPASAAQLARVEALFGAVPDDLRALWALGGDLSVFGEPDGIALLSPSTAASTARDLRAVGAPDHLIPIATDHAGNYACVDAKRGRVVDWDHETREVTALAPTLAALLEKRFVAPLARDAKDAAAIAEERAAAKAAPAALVARPTKLAALSTALVAKLDRPGYAGGARAMVFVGDDRLAMGFQNSVAIVALGGAKADDVWTGGDGLAFAPRTGRLLAASWGVVALVDVAKKALVARFQAEVGHGAVAAFSPDGAIAAVGDTSGWVSLFDVAGGKGIPPLKAGKTLHSYELPKGKPAARLEGEGFVHALAFSPDGATLAVASSAGTVRLWDVRARAAGRTLRCKGPVLGVDWARDGRALYAALESGKVEVIDPANGKALRSFATRPAARSVRALDNGVLAVIGKGGAALHDPATGKAIAKVSTRAGWPPRIGDVRGARIATVAPAMVLEAR